MLADDDYTMKLLLEEMLTSMGYDVVGQAESGEQAVLMARDLKPDVILMDILMPGHMDGISAAKKIRLELDMAIVFLTGYGDPEYVERARQVEPFGYVMKPFTEEEIRASVEIALYKNETEKKLKDFNQELIKVNRKLKAEMEERNKCDQVLRESEEKYRFLAENMVDLVWTLDPNFRTTYVSPSVEKVLGFTADERKRQSLEEMIPPESVLKVQERLMEEIERDKEGDVDLDRAITMEIEYYRKDGSMIWMENRVKMLRDSRKAFAGLIGVSRDISDRKRAEQELEKSRREWEGIFQGIGHSTLILNADQRLVHANNATEKATGKTETELIGKKCYEIFHHTDEPPEGCPFKKMIASGHLETVEIEALGGAYLVSCTPMVDEKGRIEKVIHIATDITERKKAEDALRASELWLQNIFNSLEDVTLVISLDKKILQINEAGKKILGYSEEEVIGLSPEVFHVDHEHFVEFVNRVSQAFSMGKGVNFEFESKRKNGEIFPSEHTLTLLKDGQGMPLGILSVARDITERKKAEAALKASEEKYRDLVENINEVIFAFDTTGTVIYISPAIENITGYTPSEAMGKSVMEFLHPDDRAVLAERLKEFILSGGIQPGEYRVINKTGDIVWIRSSSQPVIEDGKIVGVQGVITDISQSKRMEAQLRQAQKMEAISTLTGGIAHDYNNLLAVIMGNLSLAREEAEAHSLMMEFLRQAEQASSKAKDLTHRLMILSQGGYPMKERGSIGRLLELIQGEMQAHEASTTFSIQDDLWPVAYDSRQMHFAIKNVLINAVEAMPRGGKITVQAKNQVVEDKGQTSPFILKEGKYVRISVKDEGEGIPEEHLSKILDPYFSTKERGAQKGMGLGLTTAYAVVQKHGGHMVVNSTIGVGTTVTLYLPASDFGLKEEEVLTQSAIRNPKSEIRKVLVMDDEESLRYLARMMLERLGYEVETVKDGVEAIETYKKNMTSGSPFDAVILDLTIKGGMGGDDAIKELIKIAPDVKAIVCSGYFNDPVLAHYAEHGFCGAMAKPYQMKDLDRVLKEILG